MYCNERMQYWGVGQNYVIFQTTDSVIYATFKIYHIYIIKNAGKLSIIRSF